MPVTGYPQTPCAHSSLDRLRLRVEVIVHHGEIKMAAVTQVLDAMAKRPPAAT